MRKWLAPMLYNVYRNEPEAAPPINIEPVTFASPAKGDAYDFAVTLHRNAHSAGKRVPAVFIEDMPEMEAILQRACERVRTTTRRFGITEGGMAEFAVNEELAGMSGSMIGIYRWTVRAEVNVPDEIRQLNRDAYRKQHEIRSDAAAALLRIANKDQVRIRWQEFLAAVEGNARVAQAVQLADDPKLLPRIVADLVEQREQGAQVLLGTIDKIMQNYQSVDMLDFAVANETVLRKTLELLGLPVPPEDDMLLGGT
jgi:hypothetical protein